MNPRKVSALANYANAVNECGRRLALGLSIWLYAMALSLGECECDCKCDGAAA